jgi:hypothetical protein
LNALKKASASFLKKRSKKLLLLRPLRVTRDRPRGTRSKSFFASPGGENFFSKKEALT